MGLNRLADLRADRVDRVQRGHRVLEDHRHLVAAHFLQLVLVHGEDVAAFVENLAFEARSEEHTSELQSHSDLVCRLLLEKKNIRQGEKQSWNGYTARYT